MSDKVNLLTVEAVGSNLDKITAFIEENVENPLLVSSFCIAADEIFSNIVKFAYKGKQGSASFKLSVSEQKAVMEIRDSGEPFNPLLVQDPDTSLSAQDRSIGGLGIFLVKKMMDNVSYSRDGKENVLVVEKYIK